MGTLTPDLRYPMVTSMLFAYSTLLAPAFHYLWLYAGSGNANFYFAINVVHSVAIGALLLDAAWAWGREQWEKQRATEQGGIALKRAVAPADNPPTPGSDARRARVVVQA